MRQIVANASQLQNDPPQPPAAIDAPAPLPGSRRYFARRDDTLELAHGDP
jgi:hypothetical protein